MFLIHFVFQAYEGEVAYLKAQHQEVGNALLEREKEFQAVMLKNKELKKTISNMVSRKQTRNFFPLEILTLESTEKKYVYSDRWFDHKTFVENVE